MGIHRCRANCRASDNIVEAGNSFTALLARCDLRKLFRLQISTQNFNQHCDIQHMNLPTMSSQIYSRYIPQKRKALKESETISAQPALVQSNAGDPATFVKVDAASIYARYIPPTKAPEELKKEKRPAKDVTWTKQNNDNGDEVHASKRRRGNPALDVAKGIVDASDSNLLQNRSEAVESISKNSSAIKKRKQTKPVSHIQDDTVMPGTATDTKSPLQSSVLDSSEPREKSKKKKSKEKKQEAPRRTGDMSKDEKPTDNSSPEHITERHKKVLEKREKSLRKARKLAEHRENHVDSSGNKEVDSLFHESDVEMHDLVPLPQPAPKPQPAALSTLSALPSWLSDPIRVPASTKKTFVELGVPQTIASRLADRGFAQAFAVQAAVLPLLLPESTSEPGDVLVSAATGSGKTLSYVLPMIADISQRNGTKLRGLIVMPTRELVAQAKAVCDICSSAFATGDRRHTVIGTALGSEILATEQQQLMVETLQFDPQAWKQQQQRLNAHWEDSDWESDDDDQRMLQDETEISLPDHIKEHRSKVDILICTPGRLVEHLRGTPGFTLRHLQWLVMDEADKLLDQSFQEWLGFVIAALPSQGGGRIQVQPVRKVILSATLTRDVSLLEPLELRRPKFVMLEANSGSTTAEGEEVQTHVLPSQLEEFAVKVVDDSAKPLYLLALLESQDLLPQKTQRQDSPAEAKEFSDAESTSCSSSATSDTNSSSESSSSSSESDSDCDSSDSADAQPKTSTQKLPQTEATTPSRGVLIFTSSTTSTLRLARLLTLLQPHLASSIAPLTKSTPTSARNRTLRLFARNRIPILIASDLVSRGLDLPNLQHVINYDAPSSVKSYVHRVGRTARAGKQGRAWTLLADREARWWWNSIGRAEGVKREGKVTRVDGLWKALDDGKREEYEVALKQLESEARNG